MPSALGEGEGAGAAAALGTASVVLLASSRISSLPLWSRITRSHSMVFTVAPPGTGALTPYTPCLCCLRSSMMLYEERMRLCTATPHNLSCSGVVTGASTTAGGAGGGVE